MKTKKMKQHIPSYFSLLVGLGLLNPEKQRKMKKEKNKEKKNKEKKNKVN